MKRKSKQVSKIVELFDYICTNNIYVASLFTVSDIFLYHVL